MILPLLNSTNLKFNSSKHPFNLSRADFLENTIVGSGRGVVTIIGSLPISGTIKGFKKEVNPINAKK